MVSLSTVGKHKWMGKRSLLDGFSKKTRKDDSRNKAKLIEMVVKVLC